MKKVSANILITALVSIPVFAMIFLPRALYASEDDLVIFNQNEKFLALGAIMAITVWAYYKNKNWINQKGKYARLQIVILTTFFFVFSVFWIIKNFSARYQYVRTIGDNDILYLPYDWFVDYSFTFIYCWIVVAFIATLLFYASKVFNKRIRDFLR